MTYVGIDIGGTGIKGGILDGQHFGATVRVRHQRLGPETAAADRRTELKHRIQELVAALGRAQHVDGVGIAVFGFINADRTQVTNGTLGLEQTPLSAEMAADIGLPVLMENDGNCATWAEYVSGPGAGRDPFILLTFGTGLGGGIIAGGRLIKGGHGLASELGHICIDPDGPQCVCGGIGCVELFASGRALIRAFAADYTDGRVIIPPIGPFDRSELETLEQAFAVALARGEPSATHALRSVGQAAGRGLTALARVLDPELVAIGGGLSELGPPLIDAIRTGILASPGMTPPLSEVPVVLARHGNYAGALGAALLAAENFVPAVFARPPRASQPMAGNSKKPCALPAPESIRLGLPHPGALVEVIDF